MVRPLWLTTPMALRRFNYGTSLPRTFFSSAVILLGLKRLYTNKVVVLTTSISQDYARLWYYYAKKSLPKEHFEFVIVDSSGEFKSRYFEGAKLVRFVNFYHGKKVDILIRKFIYSDYIFLCDDDKYIIKANELLSLLSQFTDPKVAVISLAPRRWWYFELDGKIYLPMGSYAIILNRKVFLKHNLRLESPRGHCPYKRFVGENTKQQWDYDTADYANLQLLKLGYRIVTITNDEEVVGFDGMSAPRILLMYRGKHYVRDALLEADHFREGSTNGTIMKGLYCITKFEEVYQYVFAEKPEFVSGFEADELRELVERHPKIQDEEKNQILAYFDRVDSIQRRLVESA